VGRWRRLHKEELHNLYASLNTVGMMISRRMSWTGRVARTEEMRNAYTSFVGKTERKRQLERFGVHGKVMLDWVLEK